MVGSAIALLAAQPAWAQATQVTGVQLNPANGGVNLVLQTQDGDRPQVFTVSRGNALIADVVNTQLRLPEGNGFLQNNPAPGISSVVVNQLDENSVRITVNGEAGAPVGQIGQSDAGVMLSFLPSSGAAPAAAVPPVGPPAPAALPEATIAQAPAPAPAPAIPPQVPAPDVLVPNPGISIDGVPIPAPLSTGAIAPPLQSRAIAPPLGDIAVSNVDATSESIDLGTGELVPRLVLRDAPVRDVLSLLARAAGLNVAYISPTVGQEGAAGDVDPVTGEAGPGGETRISLDIENEPVQNVFNYVLRISGLEANRQGRTIFVGPRLPDAARNVIARSLRLNQVSVNDAANILTAQGAETQIPFTRVEIQSFGEGAAARTVEVRTPEILALRAQPGNGPLLLQGLSVTTDTRLNTITLIGSPRRVEIASEILAQLDLRQRQVAVNVRIVDVNLLATEDFGTSFSFGVGDSFFTSDGGAASFNFGGTRPPNQNEIAGSPLSPPVITNPFTGEPFLDPEQRLNIPGGGGGFIDENGNFTPTDATFLRPIQPFGEDGDPLNPGITEFDLGTPTVRTRDPETGRITVSPGTASEITSALPSLFRFPTRFLASLQAQIISGNAKILTDPTVVVQEGQRARVQLTQQVPINITTEFDDETGRATTELELADAGVILDVLVERIDDNGFVTLSLRPEVSAIADTRIFLDTEINLLSQRILDSGRLRIRDGQTLILSGIIQERDQTTVTKVPILGDIPLLGALFRSTNRENQRNEVIVLLTPQILDDSDRAVFGYSYTPGRETQQILDSTAQPAKRIDRGMHLEFAGHSPSLDESLGGDRGDRNCRQPQHQR
ncbi:MAG: AMIN domain-containing protein [Leptolyngbyaceae cyanobacterium SM1_3_5]|nr:AMIN domain-containing protein [Leptolyngbyaceae cyanobacterium SM1_3_5]